MLVRHSEEICSLCIQTVFYVWHILHAMYTVMFYKLLTGVFTQENIAYKNMVTSQSTISHVPPVTGLLLIFD